MEKKLNILFVISEADPLIKIGGLGDVGGTLPQALLNLPLSETSQTKIDIRIVIPYHDVLKANKTPVEWIVNYKIPWNGNFQEVYVSKAVGTDVPIYLIDGEPVRNKGTYNSNTYVDAYKYTFFSVAALELCRWIQWKPNILHAHDWHAAVSVQKLNQIRGYDPIFKTTKSLYTIHNLPYSGGNHPDVLNQYDVLPAFTTDIPPYMRTLPMALGLAAADKISTVSETYAEEIMTDEFGNGYQQFLKAHSDKVCGIVNGIMMDQWNPKTDRTLYQNYSTDELDERVHNKLMLQQELRLPQAANIPLFVIIGRMSYQKGIDLCIQAFQKMADRPWQAIILGTGEDAIQASCLSLANAFPDRVRAEIRFDAPLSRKMYAGGDILLMPSRYEPCGIAQMISMLYGCVPLARSTGGLKDTISDPFTSLQDYTGFLFNNADASAAEWAMRRALDYYQDQNNWRMIQQRGMKQDFSWKNSALKYFHLYQSLLNRV